MCLVFKGKFIGKGCGNFGELFFYVQFKPFLRSFLGNEEFFLKFSKRVLLFLFCQL